MQGYGRRGARSGSGRRARAWVPATIALAVALAGCGLGDDTAPSKIVLPPTDELITETSSSVAPTSRSPRTSRERDNEDQLTYGRVLAATPRVDKSDYRTGSVTPTSPRQETSGFHFSTPDRRVNCSTGTYGTTTLACRVNGDGLDSDDSSTPSVREESPGVECDWANNLVTLNEDGPRHGGCTNRFGVRYRSTILPFDEAISVSRFTCVSAPAALFCLESRSDTGFSVTAAGFQPITSTDTAASELKGPSGSESREPSESDPPGGDSADREGSDNAPSPATTTPTS